MTMSHAEAGKRGGEAHAAKRKAEGKVARPKPVPKQCVCGCGDMTKGGMFCMGHDARHKRNLIAEALAGNKDAEAELDDRGWTKFLEKSREVASKPKRERRKEQVEVKLEESEARMDALRGAADRLKSVGRYFKASGMKLEITKQNAERIVAMSDEELSTITQEELDARV